MEPSLSLAEATEFIKQWIAEVYNLEGQEDLIEDTFLSIDKNAKEKLKKEELLQYMKEM